MWRIIKIVLAIYLILNLITAFFFWHRIDQFLRFMPRVQPPAYSEPINKLEAQQQDISYLETILEYDRSFSDEGKNTFLNRLGELKKGNKVLSSADFYLELRALMALADNAHTSADSSASFEDFNRSGVDLYPFSDGYYIVRAHKDHANLLGQKVIAIEGQPIEDVIINLRRYTGGPDNWRDLQSLQLLRSPELLHAAGLINSPSTIDITIEGKADQVSQIKLEALAAIESMDYYRHAFLSLSPEALGDEGEDWVRALGANSETVAPYLQGLSDIVKSLQIEGGLYVRSNYLMGSPENPVKKMLLAPLAAAPEDGYAFIVVDLRWNPGGDYGNAAPFAQQIKSALAEGGKIYVITGPNTFSAAIVFSALIRQAAGEQTLIVGEPMGDRPQFWAERGKPFVLPNSNYWMSYSVGYHDWEKGCADTHKYCFPPNKRWEQDIGSLHIDHTIVPSYTNYASGRDVVMDWILEREAR